MRMAQLDVQRQQLQQTSLQMKAVTLVQSWLTMATWITCSQQQCARWQQGG